MAENRESNLQELVPIVQEHLLPMVQEAVDTCVRAHADDEYNNNFTFGTHVWGNLWNRLSQYAAQGATPFEPSGDAKDYSIRVRGVRLKPHSVRTDTRLPNSARSIKKRIDAVQLKLFTDDEEAAWLPGTVVLAFAASPEEGLTEVFLGVLQKTGAYEWREAVPVFQRDKIGDLETTSTAVVGGTKRADEEPEIEPEIAVDPNRHQQPPVQAADGE